MFFNYNQNNSGGYFDVNNDVTVNVYIEANSVEEANTKAEEIGIYFDGCEYDRDCPCCGDRWYRADSYDEVTEVPEASRFDVRWVKVGEPHTIVYYADGSVERKVREED